MKILIGLLVLLATPAWAIETWVKTPGLTTTADECDFSPRGSTITQWCFLDTSQASDTGFVSGVLDVSMCENFDIFFVSELDTTAVDENNAIPYMQQSDTFSATHLEATNIRAETLTGDPAGTDLSKMLGEAGYKLYFVFNTDDAASFSRVSVACHPRPSR